LARSRELVAALADPDDLHRALHCLAEIGDAHGYRDLLLAGADRLGVLVRGADDPAATTDRADRAESADQTGPADQTGRAAWGGRVAAALVTVTPPGEPSVRGFLISDHLVVTNRPGSGGSGADPAGIAVTTSAGGAAVARLWVAEGGVNLALLELAEPVDVTPLRLGHPRLVRVGDPAWLVTPGADVLSGTVERFEVFPERDLRLFKTDIALDAGHSGGPLLNELGEVVGVLTIPPGRAGAGFAVTADAVHPLLARTGLDPLAAKP
jgi:molecular chaperone DnaK